MDYKKFLIEGFCPVDKYHCLMPVEYESDEEDGVITGYHKKRMVCRHALAGACEKMEECKFFADAPDKLDKDEKWYEQ